VGEAVPALKELPRATVVVASYNRGEYLVKTLEGLLATDDAAFEIVVVDQTREYSPKVRARLDAICRRPRCRYLFLPVPNLPLARNLGLRAARGEIVIFCDDDVMVRPDYVAQHVECYRDPEVGAVAGRIVSAMDQHLFHPSGMVGRVKPDGAFIANFDRELGVDVDFGMGCNMSFRRAVLLSIGGFDERYEGNFYREEGDAFARVKRLGYRVLFEPATVVRHLVSPQGGCRKESLVPRLRSTYRNETLFFLNCMERRYLPHFFYRVLRWIYATVKVEGYSARHFLYFLGGVGAGVRSHYLERPDRLSATLRRPELP
jgi:GT2 family glycosyltransferase